MNDDTREVFRTFRWRLGKCSGYLCGWFQLTMSSNARKWTITSTGLTPKVFCVRYLPTWSRLAIVLCRYISVIADLRSRSATHADGRGWSFFLLHVPFIDLIDSTSGVRFPRRNGTPRSHLWVCGAYELNILVVCFLDRVFSSNCHGGLAGNLRWMKPAAAFYSFTSLRRVRDGWNTFRKCRCRVTICWKQLLDTLTFKVQIP